MNQLNEKRNQRHKGTKGLGYIEESVSSEKGAQKNQIPTCNDCGKIGHTSNRCWSNEKIEFNGKCYNFNHHGHKANECKEKPKFEGKCHKCKKYGQKYFECKTKIVNLVEQIVKEIFGWDYNTWCRCHYCGEFGHIAMNCVKHHMRKRNITKR